MHFPSQIFFNDINHGYTAAILKGNSLWLLPFHMAVAAYFCYEKVRGTISTAIVSNLLKLLKDCLFCLLHLTIPAPSFVWPSKIVMQLVLVLLYIHNSQLDSGNVCHLFFFPLTHNLIASRKFNCHRTFLPSRTLFYSFFSVYHILSLSYFWP